MAGGVRVAPPSTYVPYRYMDIRGRGVAASIKLTDANGVPIDLSNTELLLMELIREIRALRLAVCGAIEIDVEPETVNEIKEV